MKLQNYLLSLSFVAAVSVATGCSSTEDDAPVAETYSNAAMKSMVFYSVNNLSEEVVESNATLTYNDENKVVKHSYKEYQYSYADYYENNGTIKNIPANLKINYAKSYRVEIEICDIVPDENGQVSKEECSNKNLYSVANKPETAWKNLTKFDQNVLTTAGLNTAWDKTQTKKTYTYNANRYVTEESGTTRFFYDYNGSENTGAKSTFKNTYEYVTYTSDINDPIVRTIKKVYYDAGSLDSNGSITGTKDGVAEHHETVIYDFSYNELDKLDIITESSESGFAIYKAPSVPYSTYYVYDGDQLDFIEYDSDDNLTDGGQFVYKDGRISGVTRHVPNYNNDKLNQYKWNTEHFEFVYDGNRVVIIELGDNAHVEVLYADFDNELYSFKPLSLFLDTDVSPKGDLIYNQGD